MKKGFVKNMILFIIGIAIAFIFLFPIFLLFINSFKGLKEIYVSVLSLPKKFSLENYVEAFKQLDYVRAILNSLLITCIVTAGIVVFCSMAAWVLVRYKTKTSTIIFLIFSASMLVPFQCVMLPLLRVMGVLNMTNRPGLMIANLGFASGMAIMLFHGFLKNIPEELEEAAAIDGSSQVHTFFTIVFPLAKGIGVTVAILNVIVLWNDYLLPSLVINKAGMQTLPLRTYMFFGQFTKRWDLGTAALIIAMIPVIIFYLCCQKYIIKGVTEGAVKG